MHHDLVLLNAPRIDVFAVRDLRVLAQDVSVRNLQRVTQVSAKILLFKQVRIDRRILRGLEIPRDGQQAGRVRSVGRARAQRWLAPPLAGFTTILLLPATLPSD